MCGADDRSALASSGAPQSGPRKGKGWWVSGLLVPLAPCNRVLVSIRMYVLLGSFLSVLFARSLDWTDDHHTVGTTSMCYHVDSRSFFSLHTIPHGQLQTQPLRLAIPQVRSGVRRMKLRRFRTAPISSY